MIIAMEGIDGCGKETQIKLIKKYFEKKGTKFSVLKTPDYTNPVGKAIKNYLDGKVLLDPKEAFLLYATDVLMLAKKLPELEKKSEIVLLDRYITSTIAYQCARGLEFKKALEIVKILNFPKVDKIIYIDVKPEISFSRKSKEKGKLDIHENDQEYLRKVRRIYLRELREDIMGDWVAVDGERDVEEVNSDIIEKIKI